MNFKILFSGQAKLQLEQLKSNPSLIKRYKAVIKTLALMSCNLRHPGLNTHEYSFLTKMIGKKVFESYAENNTPGAYRVFWHYGDNKGEIIIIAVTSHP